MIKSCKQDHAAGRLHEVIGNFKDKVGQATTDPLSSTNDCISARVEESGAIRGERSIPEGANAKPRGRGVQFDSGYLSPYFITDPERMEARLEDAYVLIHEKRLRSKRDLLPLLDQVTKSGKPLLIVAEDIEGEALATLVVRKLGGSLQVCAVKTPGLGNRRKAMVQYLAILTGGKAITEDLDVNLKDIQISNLGWARTFIIGKSNTVIEGGRAEYDQVFFQPKIGAPSAFTSPVHSSVTQIIGAPYGTLLA
jgi:chaperonin GroEL